MAADNPDADGRVASLIDEWATLGANNTEYFEGSNPVRVPSQPQPEASVENLPAAANLASDLDPDQGGSGGSVQDTGNVARGADVYAIAAWRAEDCATVYEFIGEAEVSYFAQHRRRARRASGRGSRRGSERSGRGDRAGAFHGVVAPVSQTPRRFVRAISPSQRALALTVRC